MVKDTAKEEWAHLDMILKSTERQFGQRKILFALFIDGRILSQYWQLQIISLSHCMKREPKLHKQKNQACLLTPSLKIILLYQTPHISLKMVNQVWDICGLLCLWKSNWAFKWRHFTDTHETVQSKWNA